jgi:hypothetical protein
MFCASTKVLSEVCVQYPVWLFVHFLNVVLSVYVNQVFSGWFLDDTCCHYNDIYILRFLVRYFYCIISMYFLIKYVSPQIATFINMYVPPSLLGIMMSVLLFVMVLVNSIIRLTYSQGLFPVILVHSRTRVPSPTLPPFPCIL